MPGVRFTSWRSRLLLLTTAAVAGLATVTARADQVYATSFTNGTLIRYDSSNPAGTLTTLSGSGAITKGSGIAVGPDGNLYIGDVGNPNAFIAPSIKRFDLTTSTLSTAYTFSGFEVFPGSLLFKGTDLLVGRNPFFGDSGDIVRLQGITTGPVTVSNYTSGGNLASSPGLAFGPDGSLYVADQTYNFGSGVATGPVKRFDSAGLYAGEVIASGSSGLFGPTGLIVSGSTLYTASIMAGTVLQTNLGTNLTQPFASSGNPFEVGPVAMLSDGTLLAGSPSGYTSSIYSFNAAGTFAGAFDSGLGQVGGIAVATVPEPSALVLGGVGIMVAAWLQRRARPTRRR